MRLCGAKWPICLLLLVLASSLVACADPESTTVPAATPPLTPNTTPTATPTAPLAMIAEPTPTPTPPAGNTAPDFIGVDVVTNETISLNEFRGSVVLLNFVNYGCSRSLNEIVSAQLLAIRDLRELRDDFIPVSIFCGCCSPSVLRGFAQQNGLTWPWILDTDNSIVHEYVDYVREYGYPTLIFVDRDQYIREVTGYTDISTLSVKIGEISQY